jgi:hypothetical protein
MHKSSFKPNPPPELDWSTVQARLGNMPCDVLILLDACESAASVTSAQRGNSRCRTEVMAGSEYTGVTFGFAHRLAETLDYKTFNIEPFIVANLYKVMLEPVIQETTSKWSGEKGWG